MSSKRDKDLAAKLMSGCGALDIDERRNKERLLCVPSPSAMEEKKRGVGMDLGVWKSLPPLRLTCASKKISCLVQKIMGLGANRFD